ncbi:plant UBX domain-containing protein 9 [Punica granatum]|uniref:Plant UBX domain-containing protein 9 n=1 Tax=Punica granatum TaxID=22663 RepID=A0A218VV89_PUNGR|nr:plant UBX domain-containing protein 9 [Punica granatum]OWM64189.1 hypothetical protein CDL15_Pgr018760 [Punica granatum]
MATPTPTPTRQALETYMSITGASESLALLKLQEHGGDLTKAVNAHFTEGFPDIENPPSAVNPHYNSTGMNSQAHTGQRGILPFLSAVRSFKPSSLLDPNYRRNFLNQIGVSASRNSLQVGYPINNTGDNSHQSASRPPLHPDYGAEMYNSSSYESYAEQQMIQAAIEASKQEASSSPGLRQGQVLMEDEELNHAIALSLMTAEQEITNREAKDRGEELGGLAATSSAEEMKEGSSKPGSSSHRDEAGHAEGPAGQKSCEDTQLCRHGHHTIPSDEQSRTRLVTKAVSLPQEPLSDDVNAINLVVRMPDSSRHGRRFLKSDKLQSLFDFVDLCGWAEPGSYRLVAPYPRRAFVAGDCSSSLSALGLTSKQEALFLELI